MTETREATEVPDYYAIAEKNVKKRIWDQKPFLNKLGLPEPGELVRDKSLVEEERECCPAEGTRGDSKIANLIGFHYILFPFYDPSSGRTVYNVTTADTCPYLAQKQTISITTIIKEPLTSSRASTAETVREAILTKERVELSVPMTKKDLEHLNKILPGCLKINTL
ncbi:hypothetical protein DAPPUDRAFT_333117 [Daphnia pulex]|uniref:Uncharacterized protein n=1 Tax=Daphnia pulex TaxID=6669 RepID=E9HRW9_DAPPU|nr:hypothetical protein DAPPUDRAFT_333117 [Daphnia pulex]|eukprot:EFX65523.1 hypothetical protein DAPPUDRAFT_333117 [Daphnia pulex]